jgi:hypothetical protein
MTQLQAKGESLFASIYKGFLMREHVVKHITVQLLGSEREPRHIYIQPGATASEILAEADLENYRLATSPKATEAFHEEEDLYAQLNDSDTLYAMTYTAEANNYIRRLAYREENI